MMIKIGIRLIIDGREGKVGVREPHVDISGNSRKRSSIDHGRKKILIS